VDTSAKNNDGFTEVVSRRTKGNKAANQQPKNQITGIRLHKPKSTFYRPINKKANDKQFMKKPATNEQASTSHASGSMIPEEGADCGDVNPLTDGGKAQEDGDVQNLNGEAAKKREEDNMWSNAKEAKEVSDTRSSRLDIREESDEDEVYCPNAEYTSGMGGGFSMDEDALDGYDGYEAH
ncbi:hypothetical protein Tco_0342810, partial [Tanacetum coccineum]